MNLREMTCLARHKYHLVEWEPFKTAYGTTNFWNTWACKRCGTVCEPIKVYFYPSVPKEQANVAYCRMTGSIHVSWARRKSDE